MIISVLHDCDSLLQGLFLSGFFFYFYQCSQVGIANSCYEISSMFSGNYVAMFCLMAVFIDSL
jgi:hypothetical protein